MYSGYESVVVVLVEVFRFFVKEDTTRLI